MIKIKDKLMQWLNHGVLMPALWLTTVGHVTCYGQHMYSADRLARLESAINKILRDANAPGVGVAIVSKDGPVLVRGFGKADIKRNINVNENTLFRIASISKMFVALSILKLQEEGRLHLDDRVRGIAPEIAFENPWEDTHPVRVVHLLEHTTGWDEYHLAEQTNVQLTLKEGLDLHPHSRRSRWVPGSRVAYSNSGYGVAGYIVEKISGQPYEGYVEEHFFRPLWMTNATFFYDERYRRRGATLYGRDLVPLGYRHVIQRPSGAINSSSKELANFIQFLLNRGRVDSLQVISRESMDRMETTLSTPGARVGLELGYGLANFTSVYKGFVYQGHNGGLPGALSELAYLPENGVGHVILMNSMNGHAFTAISNLIRDFELERIARDTVVNQSGVLPGFTFDDGYYVSLNPRIQLNYFIDRLIDVYEFRKKDSVLVKSWILPGSSETFYPLSDSTFRSGGVNKVSLVKAIDPLEGDVLVTDSRVYKHVPSIIVHTQVCLLTGWIFMMAIGGLLWAFSLAMFWMKRSRDAIRVTTYPMLATALFLLTGFLVVYLAGRNSEALTGPGLLSLTLMALSVWWIVSVVWSLVVIYSARRKRVSRITYWAMVLLSGLHAVVVFYLMWFDVLPVITWL